MAMLISAIVFLVVGIGLFIFFLLPSCIAGLNPPPPAPCCSPLVDVVSNPTHVNAGHGGIKHVAIIYNPHAGKGKAGHILNDVVIPTLRSHGVTVEEIPTQRVGHAREIGMETDLTRFDGLVVMGGDGTIHEVANGLLSRGEDAVLPPLGFVPLGSGNAIVSDFRQSQRRRGREISVYSELEAVGEWAAERVADGRSCCVDTLDVDTQGQRIACIAITYFGVVSDIDVMGEPLRCFGPLRLDIAAVWAVMKRRPMDACSIRAKLPDGTERIITNSEEDWIGLSVNLTQHWSDSTRASPVSQLDDGVCELSILKCGRSRRQLLKAMSLLATGAHTIAANAAEMVEIVPFTELTINFHEGRPPTASSLLSGESPGPLKPGLFDVDGEMFRHDGSVRMAVKPRSWRLFVDPEEECGTDTVAELPEEPPMQAQMSAPFTGALSSRNSGYLEYKVYPRRWLNVAIFCFCIAANQIIWITFAPIASTTEKAYNVGSTYVNFLSLSYMLVYFLVTFPASKAIDRLGCRPALFVGVVLTAIGAVLRAVASVLDNGDHPMWVSWGLMVGQGFAGFGQPFLMNMPPKLANVWFPMHQRVAADTICSMSAPLGAAVGFLLPSAITGGDADKMTLLLEVEAAICVVSLFFMFAFQNEPPTPPSAAAAATHELLVAPAAGRASVLKESLTAMKDRDFLALQVAFSFGLGTFNTLGTMIDQFVAPFGFSEEAASDLGALTIVFGLVGAVLFAAVLGYTHNHRLTLMLCFFSASVAGVVLAVAIPYRIDWLVYAATAVLGLGMTPVMPLAFETCVELMHPDIGEATLSGLCMGGGQAVGIGMTLVFQALCQHGHAGISLWLIAVGVLLGGVSISFVRKKSIGARRRKQESVTRQNSRRLRLASQGSDGA